MKKTILALALMGSGAATWAQDSLKTTSSMQNATEMQTTQTSTNFYNAYGTVVNVPATTQSYLMRDYPSANNVTWQQSGDWYRANYINNNRNMQVYYAPNGNSFTVALPVIQSWVPEEVVTSALHLYGTNIYSINKIKGASGQELYQVTILDNGTSRSEYLNANGGTVAAIDVFKNEGNEMNTTNSTMSNNGTMDQSVKTSMDTNSNTTVTDATDVKKTKSKVKEADGKILKVKTRGNKTKTIEKPSVSDNMNQ